MSECMSECVSASIMPERSASVHVREGVRLHVKVVKGVKVHVIVMIEPCQSRLRPVIDLCAPDPDTH
eukprot:687646-Rhodomonas_salina.2